jgi:hypothetical protein
MFPVQHSPAGVGDAHSRDLDRLFASAHALGLRSCEAGAYQLDHQSIVKPCATTITSAAPSGLAASICHGGIFCPSFD